VSQFTAAYQSVLLRAGEPILDDPRKEMHAIAMPDTGNY
jgi:hypothetical protein